MTIKVLLSTTILLLMVGMSASAQEETIFLKCETVVSQSSNPRIFGMKEVRFFKIDILDDGAVNFREFRDSNYEECENSITTCVSSGNYKFLKHHYSQTLDKKTIDNEGDIVINRYSGSFFGLHSTNGKPDVVTEGICVKDQDRTIAYRAF